MKKDNKARVLLDELEKTMLGMQEEYLAKYKAHYTLHAQKATRPFSENDIVNFTASKRALRSLENQLFAIEKDYIQQFGAYINSQKNKIDNSDLSSHIKETFGVFVDQIKQRLHQLIQSIHNIHFYQQLSPKQTGVPLKDRDVLMDSIVQLNKEIEVAQDEFYNLHRQLNQNISPEHAALPEDQLKTRQKKIHQKGEQIDDMMQRVEKLKEVRAELQIYRVERELGSEQNVALKSPDIKR